MQDTFCILHFHGSKVIRILHRLVIGIFNQPRIAAEGIRCDDRLFPFLLHKITSRFTVTAGYKNMIAFFLQP